MSFSQIPPTLGNQYAADLMLKSYLARALPQSVRTEIESSLLEMGELSGGLFYRRSLEERLDEPKLTQFSAWGERVDSIELTRLWRDLQRVASEKGLVATAYERKHGEYSRIHHFALAYLFEPSSGVYTCPLAMTDGAARTLIASGNHKLVERAVPRLMSRDPSFSWTSGQWMTEKTGGSDVGISETIAKWEGDRYRLYGTKWFTSATTSQMALTLARPEGNPPGGGGLALFYLELKDDHGKSNGITIHRLKEKLGTRMVPTAELTLDGAVAEPVSGLANGVKNITPMLTITRTWNAIGAIGGMRRAIALAEDYSTKRVAFGAPLSEKPLHMDTLFGLNAEFQGAFLLAFRAAELLGREEAGVITEEESALLRVLVSLAKLTTGKQAVLIASETLECFGGAGYVEDTGLPRLLRDAQVLPIWEGTTNVLALDVLRAIARSRALDSVEREVNARTEPSLTGPLTEASRRARDAIAHARRWFEYASNEGPHALEAGARRLALTLGRALELALLVDHAAWAAANEGDKRFEASALRLAAEGVDRVIVS